MGTRPLVCAPDTANNPETLEHRIYECNQNAFIDHPWVVKSKHLCQRACKDIKAETNSAFWLRGLVPREWTPVPCAPEWNEEHTRVWAVGKGMQAVKTETAYLDGSLTASDVRLARAGWRVAVLDVDVQNPDTASLSAGWLGTLDGEQTAPCAQLAALWWGLQKTCGHATFVTDCSLVHRGMADLRKSTETPSRHQRWWESIQRATQQRQGSFNVVRVLSHLDEDALVESGQSLVDKGKRASRCLGKPGGCQRKGPYCRRNWRC